MTYIYNIPLNFHGEIDRIPFVIVVKVNLPRPGNKEEGMAKKISNFKAWASKFAPDFWVFATDF